MKNVNFIVAVGSVDGVATTAALMNYIGTQVPVVFTQAFQVNSLKPEEWGSSLNIAFVDLAVNNSDESMTADFVLRLTAAGHKLVAVIDEHDADAWARVLGEESFNGLEIKPVSQKTSDIKSSGALFAASVELSAHAQQLCRVADNGDKMIFEGIGSFMNQTIKSAIADNSRRVALANHFAFASEPSEQITSWIAEYKEILLNNQAVINAGVELAPGIIRVSAVGVKIDMTTLMSALYRKYRVVVLEGMAYDKTAGQQTLQVSFGVNTTDPLDVMTVVDAAGIPKVGGFGKKVNVSPENEAAALVAIQAAM